MEESEGKEGSGVYFFRNLYNRKGETKPVDLTGGKRTAKQVVEEQDKVSCSLETAASVKSSMAAAMNSSRNAEARRRLSQSARANLPLLADA